MADKKKQEPKSNAPMLIIGLVLIVAAVAGWYLLTKPKTPTPANSNKAANSANANTAKATIPANAPPGASPPNQAGSPNALVTLEAFADFQCGSCAAANPVMNEIKAYYGSKINFIFRNFPLPMHDKAYDAALAAEAAGMQGKFWDMKIRVFQRRHGDEKVISQVDAIHGVNFNRRPRTNQHETRKSPRLVPPRPARP